MIKKGLFKLILILLFSLVLNLYTQSQNRKYFIITGKLISESEFIENGSIQITKNDNSIVNSDVPKDGRFRLELNYNSEYRLTFKQNGYLLKTILVNTALPTETLNKEANFPHFLMAVRLFKDNQNAANLYSEKEIQQISYSPKQDCFTRVPTIYDVEYVERGNSNQNQQIHVRLNKTKEENYRVF
jgi:hypothetical protein